MANVPVYNADNISLGPGILYIGVAGTTPTTDVGAIAEDGMEMTVSREYLEVFQGSPKQLIKQFVTSESCEVVMNTIEWNLLQLPRALGAGVTTSSAGSDTFSFGGDPNTSELAVHIRHSLPSGHTISIYIWKAQASGEWVMNMAQDTLHNFPFSLKALVATTAWDGTALAVGQQLFRIVRFKQ